MEATQETLSSPTEPVGQIQLTAEAVEQVKRILRENKMDGYGLRFGVQGGGCSGYSYLLEFEEEAQPEDEIYTFDGVRVFVNPLHLEYLKGSVVTYADTLLQAGFQIDNPNVKRKCGCGSSVDF